MQELKVPWNEWLVYSIINKYSTRLKVMVTANQFKYAKPIVCKSDVDISEIDILTTDTSGFGQVDNLADLDNLIADMIEIDMDIDIGEV